MIRLATPEDASSITALVNTAYDVERVFVEGERISEHEILGLIGRRSLFVAVHESGTLVGCVHVGVRNGLGYFGLLAVAPDQQHQGWGRRLIEAAETQGRLAGCPEMEIEVVNLRTELLDFYPRLGYRAVSTAPYVHRPIVRPCHFVIMRKTL